MSLKNSLSFTGIFFTLTLFAVLVQASAAMAEDVEEDDLTFVTDEKSGELYECGEHRCALIAKPLKPAQESKGCAEGSDTCDEQVQARFKNPSEFCKPNGSTATQEASCS